MKRLVRKVSVASIVALLFAALTSWSAAAEPTVITHLGFILHGDAWHDYMDQKIAEFESLYPNIKIERIIGGKPGQGSMEEKYATMIAGGVAPDVIEMTLSQAGGKPASLVKSVYHKGRSSASYGRRVTSS